MTSNEDITLGGDSIPSLMSCFPKACIISGEILKANEDIYFIVSTLTVPSNFTISIPEGPVIDPFTFCTFTVANFATILIANVGSKVGRVFTTIVPLYTPIIISLPLSSRLTSSHITVCSIVYPDLGTLFYFHCRRTRHGSYIEWPRGISEWPRGWPRRGIRRHSRRSSCYCSRMRSGRFIVIIRAA
jgi:hypothetical protein